jgi:hypothetical protein
MSRNNILVSSMVFLLFAVLFIHNYYYVVEEIPINIQIGEQFAIDLDPSKGIYFPEIPQGMVVSRAINISNNSGYSKKIKLKIEGVSFVSLSDNNFIIKSGENKEIKVLINSSYEVGVYEGKLLVYSNYFSIL